MANNITVIKIGGSTLGQHDTTLEDIIALQKQGRSLVVVHGGGKIITQWLSKLGASTRFVQGERVTDQTGLEVTNAVLSAVVNKELVAFINTRGGRAIGICGVDGLMLQGRIKSAELGFVGEVVKVDPTAIEILLKNSFIPVISSISLNVGESRQNGSLLLNVNADTAAGEIAAVCDTGQLIFLTDVAGICDQSGKVIAEMEASEAEAFITSGVASGGMIPKIRAAVKALSRAGEARIVDGRQSHALLNVVQGKREGTTIFRRR